MLGEGVRRRRADRRHPFARDRRPRGAARRQPAVHHGDAVHTGEDDPRERLQGAEGCVERLPGRRRLDHDRGRLQHPGAGGLEEIDEPLCLGARAGDDDRPALERALGRATCPPHHVTGLSGATVAAPCSRSESATRRPRRSAVLGGADGRSAKDLAPIVARDERGDADRGSVQHGVSGHRRVARGAQATEAGALGQRARAGGRVIEPAENPEHAAVIRPGFDRQHALTDRGHERVRVEHLDVRRGHTEPLEAGRREQYTVQALTLQLAEPGPDVAADRLDDEVGAQRQRQRAPPRASGAEPRARAQVFEASRLSRHEDVARIFALGERREREAGRELGREILEAVHGAVEGAGEEHVFDLAHEEALAADRRQLRLPGVDRPRSAPARSRRRRPARAAAPRRSRLAPARAGFRASRS